MLLPQERYIDILRKYEMEFKLKSSDLKSKEQDIEEVIKYCNNIDVLIAKIEVIVISTEKLRSQISSTMESYFKIVNEVSNFEKEQLIESVEWDPKKLIIAKDPYQDQITQMGENANMWASPFTYLDLWAKEEKYELASIKSAYNSIKHLQNKREEYEGKLAKLKESHEKLKKGQLTLQGIISTVMQKSKSKSMEESATEIKEVW